MHATLALRTTQQTALTPRLQQSVRLLQLSSNEFAQELEQAIATNPFLEVPAPHDNADDGHWTGDGNGASSSASSDKSDPVDAGPATERTDGQALPYDEAVGVAEDRGVDGYEPPPTGFEPFGDGADRTFDGASADVTNWAPAVATLRMHLHAELAGHRLDDRARLLAELIVEALDDDGYIRQELADVVAQFAVDPPVRDDEVAAALNLVQQLGPPGVAARGVSECLALQLEALTHVPAFADVRPLALAIVRDHLDALAGRDWGALRRELECSVDEVTRAVALIRSLDPRPGSAFGGEVAQAVVPDVIVRRVHGSWHADINPAVIPRVSLNRVYAALFNESRGGDRQPLGQQLQEARWLLRNAAQRFVTIRRVARVIVAEQAAFLEYGDIAIKPLLLREVADRLDLHESTISRAICNKFMATPRGVFDFKHFFSRKLATVSGGSCSATSIRAAMRELIDREDRADPMSDVVLARRLTEQGLCVARRTITKYRGLMRIPPVEMRRAPT